MVDVVSVTALTAAKGPIIRINPLQVHIHDADYFDTIYASGMNHKRDRCSWSFHTGAKSWEGAILDTIDHDLHKLRRTALAPFFSKRSVQALEELVVNNTKKLMDRFAGELEKKGPKAGVVNLNDAYAAFTMDTISEYCFGESIKTLDHDDYAKIWLKVMHDGIQIEPFARQFPTIMNFMLDLPPNIVEKLSPGVATVNTFSLRTLGRIERIMNFEDGDGDTKNLRRTIFHDIRDDVGCKLPEKEKHPKRLTADASVILGAGTETTARTLAVTTYYLIKNAELGEKLRQELKTVMPTVDHEVSLPQLEALPYLVSRTLHARNQTILINIIDRSNKRRPPHRSRRLLPPTPHPHRRIPPIRPLHPPPRHPHHAILLPSPYRPSHLPRPLRLPPGAVARKPQTHPLPLCFRARQSQLPRHESCYVGIVYGACDDLAEV